MVQDVPRRVAVPVNELVLEYLNDRSAHSDIAGVLLDAVQGLGDVQTFCPDPDRYRYLLVSTKDVVFGFAVGMSTVAFRLDQRMKNRALTTGGVELAQCGEDWVAVVQQQTDNDWPAVDVRFWARQAYGNARAMAR